MRLVRDAEIGRATGAVVNRPGGDRPRIPGLCAAGYDAASIMGGAYPGRGITLGPAMTFGYIESHSMAANRRSE